jgi:predicted ester cyclase
MSHDIGALSREWFEFVWNRRDDSAIARLASPQAVIQGLTEDGQPAQGLGPFKRFRQGILSAFPDLEVRVEDVLVDGTKTAVRLSLAGTHTGDGIGVPATGRRFVASAIVLLRWQDGKVIEAWNEFDAAGMMRQLQAPAAMLRA